MNDLKMGFKQSLLQRLQHFEMSSVQPKSAAAASTESKDSNNLQITDFSIQSILGNNNNNNKELLNGNFNKKHTVIASQDTPPTSPKLYAPIATKPSVLSSDILDLSKNKQPEHYKHNLMGATVHTHPLNEYPFSNNTTTTTTANNTNHSYAAFHPNILAAVAAANAHKFYAQFLPHMFPAAAAAGIYNNNNVTNVARPTVAYQKRYFAPYVLNTQHSPQPALQTPLTPPTPTPTTTTSAAPQTPQSTADNKLICARPDCLDCLDSYYKSSTFPYKTSLHSSPPASALSSSSTSYAAKSQKDLLLASSNISLTSVTNIHLMAGKTCRDVTHLGSSFDGRLNLLTTSEEISYKCRICDKVFGCSQTLQAHEKTHKSPRFECTDCGKGFSQLRNYKYHLSVHRGTKEFAAECPECGKTFNDKGYLSSHMKIHRNKKEYECPYCPKSFNQRVAFNMHVRIHTGVKPHKCAECGKRFSRKMLLKQHMRTHSGEKPYQCSVCGKSFADRSNMTLHHRLHSGIKPFNCPICPKAFTKKHHLKTHLNYHTGCKPYICPHPNCNQAFTQSSNMRTHAKKCQYRPLQMAYPPSLEQKSTNVASNHVSILSAATAAAAAAVTSSSMTPAEQTQSFMINPISRLPSSMAVAIGSSHAATISTNNNSSSNSIPFIPTTTLSAGIRMLSTVTSSVPVNSLQSSSSSSSSSVFPPAQQPLLSTLRPF